VLPLIVRPVKSFDALHPNPGMAGQRRLFDRPALLVDGPSGIRSRVRHPIYLGHLCEMLAWSLGTGLAVCWLLTAWAIATGALMIRLEDAEWQGASEHNTSHIAREFTQCSRSSAHDPITHSGCSYNPTWLKAET
jgi:hypothetical protein